MQARFLAIAAATLASFGVAQSTLVAPHGYAAVEGNSNNGFPWNASRFGFASMRVQFIYDSTTFTAQGVAGPTPIRRLRYRADSSATTWTGGTYPQVQIDMSTCPVDFTAVSGTFASNHGPDQTTVLSGPVTVAGGTGTSPGPWHIDIPLTTPFLYDPTSGRDLTVDIRLTGSLFPSGTFCQVDHVSGSTTVPPPRGSRVYDNVSNTPNGLTGTAVTHYVSVCEFEFGFPSSGLYPAFSATPNSGTSPLLVQFTDRSYSSDPGGVTAWQWDLDGDSVIDSTVQNPSFVYTGYGRYHVSLTATDATHGSVSVTRYFFITVNRPSRLEVEPNETKAQALASGAFVMNHGDALTGTTTGAATGTPGLASADTWLVRTAPLPPGIYRHRLVPTSETLLHTVTLRSTSAVNASLDNPAQTSSSASTPPRFVQWYGFGRSEQIYVRVTGTTSTTAPYTLALKTTAVAPQVIPGGFAPGNITFDARGRSSLDNEIRVFDGSRQEIRDYQNDQPFGLTGNQFVLNRPFTAGTYYLAVMQFNGLGAYPTASSLPGAPGHYYPGSLGGERTPSPAILDFPDAMCTSASGTTGSNSFGVTDSLATLVNVTAPPNQRSEIQWYRMQVGDPGCAAGGSPVITASPPSLEVCFGSSVTLSVAASGTAPLSYQWWFNGTPIPALVGGTNPDLVLSNLDASYTGSYVCQVTNACGWANSHPALLTVHLFGPMILDQPDPVSLHCLGEMATFSVLAHACIAGALSYQWYHDQSPIPGATNSTLQFPLAGLADRGQYLCRVTEAGFGFTDSSPALLSVSNAPPVITLNGDSYVNIECHVGSYTELGATVTDDCDTNLTVTISGTVDPNTIGYYYILYSVVDSSGNAASIYRYVYVVDTIPPTVQVAVANPALWSPQHDMVNVGLSVQIEDACSGPGFTPPYAWVEAYSNETELAATGDGSGRHAPDAKDLPASYWSNPEFGTLRLRAERSALGTGRIYVIFVYAYDENWNIGFGIKTVVCPTDESNAARTLLQAEADSLAAEATSTGYYWDMLNLLWNRGYTQVGLEPETGPRQ